MRILLLLIALILPAAVARAAAPAEVRVGILAYQGAERAMSDWAPTLAALDRAIPGRHFVPVPLDLDGMTQAVRGRQVEFIVTNPGDYLGLEAQFGVTRIATLQSRQAGSASAAVASTVIVRRERGDLKRLADLKGKRLAVVAADAFGGFQVAWREMAAAGIDPFNNLADLRTTGFPMERVAWMVREGGVDAGVLRACVLEELIADGRVGADEFKVLGERDRGELPCRVSTPLYPDWPFARLAHTSGELARQVAVALLTMTPADGKGWTAPLDYTPVHRLMRELHIEPYGRAVRPTLAELALRNWHWLAAAAAAVLWWVLHVARVEVLVRRRTAELEHEIAERTRAEDNAARHREERDRMSRLGILGEMSSNIAHELNQPLAAIANYAHGITRMLEGGRAEPALLGEAAAAVAQQADRAAGIIQRIRAFVRRRPHQRVMLDLNEVVRDTLALFEPLAGRRAAAIAFEPAAMLPPVAADRVEIEQVLLNLLQNAVDAIDAIAGGGRGGTISVATATDGGMVVVAVRDDGPGLAPDAEAHLFEPFYTTKAAGLGLGLSICRTIVEGHGGRLWAAANPEGGVTMRFSLPICAEAEPP